MTEKNRLPSGSGTNFSWDRIRDVYTTWESLGNTDRPRTDEELHLLYKYLFGKEWFLSMWEESDNARSRIKKNVEKWVSYPTTFYPFEDFVQVKRACDFHFSTWQILTPWERHVTINRLAQMWDPWEFATTDLGGFEGTWVETILPTLSNRMHRWYTEFNEKERENIVTSVQRARQRGGYRWIHSKRKEAR